MFILFTIVSCASISCLLLAIKQRIKNKKNADYLFPTLILKIDFLNEETKFFYQKGNSESVILQMDY